MGKYYVWPLGNFAGQGETITAQELAEQPGKFGYLRSHNELCFRGNKMYINPEAIISRRTEVEAIRVEAMSDGFKIEFIAFDELPPSKMRGKPGRNAIPVKQLKASGKVHTRWDDDLLYINIETLPVSERPSYFIERVHLLETQVGVYYAGHLCSVKKKGGKGRVPIRRLSTRAYEIKLSQGWTGLAVMK